MHDLLASTSDELFNLARQIRSPATVLTNLLLAVQCAVQAHRVSAHGTQLDREPRVWAIFFACVGASAVLGGVKHGTAGLLDPTVHTGIAAASNLSLGAGIATLHGVMIPGRTTARAAWGLAYVVAACMSAVLGSFSLTGLAAAIGLAPVVAVGFRDAGLGRPGGLELATAWAVAGVAGVAWVTGPAPADWFGRVDVAHVVLMVALGFLLLGAERRVEPASAAACPTRSVT